MSEILDKQFAELRSMKSLWKDGVQGALAGNKLRKEKADAIKAEIMRIVKKAAEAPGTLTVKEKKYIQEIYDISQEFMAEQNAKPYNRFKVIRNGR